jgi:hypothetical protein
LISRLEKRDSEVDVIFAKLQESGNWYSTSDDIVIPIGRPNKMRFVVATNGDVLGNEFLKVTYAKNGISNYETFIEYVAKLKISNDVPRIDKKSKRKSLLINGRVEKNTEFTIRNTIQKLGDGWGHLVYTSTKSLQEMTELCNSISPLIEVYSIDPLTNRNDYNNICLDEKFWKSLKIEHVLVYQTDTIIFNKLDEDFFKYDYIGAPWEHHWMAIRDTIDILIKVGNGGLSLRNVDVMLSILKDEDSIILKTAADPSLDKIPEDVFYSYYIKKIGKIAPVEIAEKFSIEPIGGNYDKITVDDISKIFGAHRIYDSYGWIDLLDNFYFKKVYFLSGVSAGGSRLYIKRLEDSNNLSGLDIQQISKKRKLKKLNKGDYIIIQHFIETDITIDDIIDLKSRGVKILIFIHDYHLFAPNEQLLKYYGEYTYAEPRLPLLMPKMQRLFEMSESIVCNSQYTLNFIKKIPKINTNYLKPIDHIENRVIKNVPIYNNTINIGILANINLFKGYTIYFEIFNIREYKGYKIIYHIFGETRIEYDNIINHGYYNEDEIYEKLDNNKINGLLFFNMFPETYGYAATKGINSGLPICYNLIGSYTERFIGKENVFPAKFGKEKDSYEKMLDLIIDKAKVDKRISPPLYIPKIDETFFEKFINILND